MLIEDRPGLDHINRPRRLHRLDALRYAQARQHRLAVLPDVPRQQKHAPHKHHTQRHADDPFDCVEEAGDGDEREADDDAHDGDGAQRRCPRGPRRGDETRHKQSDGDGRHDATRQLIPEFERVGLGLQLCDDGILRRLPLHVHGNGLLGGGYGDGGEVGKVHHHEAEFLLQDWFDDFHVLCVEVVHVGFDGFELRGDFGGFGLDDAHEFGRGDSDGWRGFLWVPTPAKREQQQPAQHDGGDLGDGDLADGDHGVPFNRTAGQRCGVPKKCSPVPGPPRTAG